MKNRCAQDGAGGTGKRFEQIVAEYESSGLTRMEFRRVLFRSE